MRSFMREAIMSHLPFDTASEAVASAFFSEAPFARALVAMAHDGAARGWHEANGGNATYRLTREEAGEVEAICAREGCAAGAWEDLAAPVPDLAGEMFLVSAAGSFMGKLGEAPAQRLGIVELGEGGMRFRIVLGLCGGNRPTSEFTGHLLIHEALMQRDRAARVLYHAHPDPLIALSKLIEVSPRCVTRTLWKATTECILVVPEGVGAVPCLVPGSLELARASAEQMRRFRAVLWAQHGLLCSGSTCDDAFGRMDSLAKAARVHLMARSAGGDDSERNDVPDECLRAISEQLHLGADTAFLAAEGK